MQYLERRFSRSVRTLGSTIFLFQMVSDCSIHYYQFRCVIEQTNASTFLGKCYRSSHSHFDLIIALSIIIIINLLFEGDLHGHRTVRSITSTLSR